MKIAILCEQVDRRRGGAETSTLEMSLTLADLGHDVVQVVAGAGRSNQVAENGVRVVECGGGGSTKLTRTRSYVKQADAFCRTQAFDVVHAVTPCLSCDVYQPRGGTYQETIERTVARAGGFWTRAFKSIGRRLNRRQRYLLSLERALLGGSNPPYVAAVSEYVGRQILAAFPCFTKQRLRVVFNGVNIRPSDESRRELARSTIRSELKLNPQSPLILFVAHNFKLKGLRELIRACALTPRDASASSIGAPPTVAVVGRDDEHSFAALARRLGVDQRVRFVGPVDDLTPYYDAADLLAHPTWYDPCSRVVLEALGRGLPVVTTRFNGAAEVIEEGSRGVVIDSPGNIEALAAALQRGLDKNLGRACRESAEVMREQLSMARHARELVTLYEQVVSDKRG